VLAIVDAPLLGERFVAVEGTGAFRNGAPIRVASRERGDPLVALSDFAFGHKHRETNPLRLAVIGELVRRRMRLRIHGSVALDLAWLACGRMSATVCLSNVPWDVSAGVLLVREAGGLVFDADGEPHGPDAAFTLAAMPSRRDELLEVISRAGSFAGAA
jgi:myo-inositol-1(or 4)-monophosphatase